MAQLTTSFLISKFFIKGFDLTTFEAAVRAVDYGVAVDSVTIGNFFTADPLDDEVVIVFASQPASAAMELLYGVVIAYVPPPPPPPDPLPPLPPPP